MMVAVSRSALVAIRRNVCGEDGQAVKKSLE